MKRILLFLLVFSAMPTFAATWYVRPAGGTRTQCTGQADANYPGSGTAQACAYKDPRLLYSDDAGGALAWVIAGGDTVIIRGGPWRIGSDTDGTVSSPWCGGAGNQLCYIPSPPSGTSGNPTIIQGENCISGCPDSSGVGPNTSLLTELYAGFGAFKVLQESGAFTIWRGFGLTRHSDCIQHGSPALPSVCNNSIPYSDFAIGGINTNQTTHDITFQDMWIHGFPDRGILGPIGGTITCTRCRISYNGMAGWDFDDGSQTPSLNNPTLIFSHSMIEFSGCNQEYPYTHFFPVTSCYSQSSGGYGDGLATAPGGPLSGVVDHSVMRYNTQDGMDWGHVDTGTSTLTATNNTFYGNNGGQFKWGYNFSSVVFQNNLVDGNCLRMSVALAGTPTTYNANLQDFCRAGSTMSYNFRTGQTLLLSNNTFITYGPQLFVIGCSNAPGSGSCNSDTITIKNNNVLGYDNPSTYVLGGQAGGPLGYYCQDNTGVGVPQIDCAANFTWARANNLYYQFNPAGSGIACPTGYANETCTTSPLLAAQPAGNAGSFIETELDLPAATSPGGILSFNLTSLSPVIGAGIAYTGQPSTDFAGVATTSPPVIGALNFSGITPPPGVQFNGHIIFTGTVKIP
jgi:hypothetical protein